jgi:hypothetical protein
MQDKTPLTYQGHVAAVLEADVGREGRAGRVPPAAVLVRAEHVPDELFERPPVPRALQQVAGSVLSSPPLSDLPQSTLFLARQIFFRYPCN